MFTRDAVVRAAMCIAAMALLVTAFVTCLAISQSRQPEPIEKLLERRLIDDLDEMFAESAVEISNLSYAAQSMLAAAGIEQSADSIMTFMRKMPRHDSRAIYAEYLNAYIEGRKRGRSHDEMRFILPAAIDLSAASRTDTYPAH